MAQAPRKLAIAPSYLELIHEFPPRPIRNGSEYKLATVIMERLAIRGENALDDGECDYLDGLDEFISGYDRQVVKHWPRRGTPRSRLRTRLNDTATTPRDLERILRCSHSLVSLVLSGKRELSKDNIRALAKHFS